MNNRHSYKDPEKARLMCNKTRKANYQKTANAPNKGKEWTIRDIDIVMAHEKTDREISKQIGRSVQAIQIMRARINSGRTIRDGRCDH